MKIVPLLAVVSPPSLVGSTMLADVVPALERIYYSVHSQINPLPRYSNPDTAAVHHILPHDRVFIVKRAVSFFRRRFRFQGESLFFLS